MRLEDALITGRPLKRAHEISWRNVQDGVLTVSREDILADDWIIKPAPLELEIYISPDRTKVSLDKNSPYDWDKKEMIEKVKE